MPDDPPEAWWPTLGAITGGREAVVATAGMEPRPLAELVAAGYVVEWDDPTDGPSATLSPWGAWALGQEIGEHWRLETGRGWKETPVWQPAGTNDRLRDFRPPPDGRGWSERKHLSLDNPAVVKELAKRAARALVMDEYSGEPVTIQGRTIQVDPRLGRKTGRTCTQ